MEYVFDVEREIFGLKAHMEKWFSQFGKKKAIVGVSGGKDSSVCLKIACDVLGKENVLGVMMPNGVQHDIADSEKIIAHCGCNSLTINIKDAYDGLLSSFEKNFSNPGENHGFKTNTPARLRMTTLYGIAAIQGGIVINTCNLSEDCAYGNFSTLFGDNAGSYSLLQGFTVTEVRAIGDALALPHDLVHKAPSDGMCGSTDEIRISAVSGVEGFTYERFDRLIRCQKHDFTDEEVSKLVKGYEVGKFKNEIVHIPHYVPELPVYFLK